MSARVIEKASLTIPLQGKHLDESGVVADPDLSRFVLMAVTEFLIAIESFAGMRETVE